MEINIPYYEDTSRISNSNIGWLLKSGPQYLHNMLNGKEEGLKLPQLERGTMIHEYILQPDEFWKDYVILDFEVPKSKQQKQFLDEYYNSKVLNPLEDPNKLKLIAYKNAYSNKNTDLKCIEEADVIISTYSDYLDYLNKKSTKKIISFADLSMLKNISNNLYEHKKANKLLFNIGSTATAHNEFHINWEYSQEDTKVNVRCKSLLDRIIIDTKNKSITLIDLKTTSDVYNFKHSIEEFDYYRQMAYYWLAIYWYCKNELNINLDEEDYLEETYIIAIQTNKGNEIRVFKLDWFNITSRLDTIEEALEEIAWHQKTDLWEHTRKYYENDGSEEI